MKTALTGIPPADRKSAAVRSCARLKGIRTWRDIRTVLVYLSFGDELDTGPVIESALSEGKSVFAPVVQDRDLVFRAVEFPDGPFERGPFGIREPGPDRRRWSSLTIPGPSLVVVPGLAFTSDGGRLGRGGGFYDRFISGIRLESRAAGEHPPLFVGYGYDIQVLEDLPLQDHDEILDGIITESAAYML